MFKKLKEKLYYYKLKKLEEKLSRYKHTMEFIRTSIGILVLLIQIIILFIQFKLLFKI